MQRRPGNSGGLSIRGPRRNNPTAGPGRLDDLSKRAAAEKQKARDLDNEDATTNGLDEDSTLSNDPLNAPTNVTRKGEDVKKTTSTEKTAKHDLRCLLSDDSDSGASRKSPNPESKSVKSLAPNRVQTKREGPQTDALQRKQTGTVSQKTASKTFTNRNENSTTGKKLSENADIDSNDELSSAHTAFPRKKTVKKYGAQRSHMGASGRTDRERGLSNASSSMTRKQKSEPEDEAPVKPIAREMPQLKFSSSALDIHKALKSQAEAQRMTKQAITIDESDDDLPKLKSKTAIPVDLIELASSPPSSNGIFSSQSSDKRKFEILSDFTSSPALSHSYLSESSDSECSPRKKLKEATSSRSKYCSKERCAICSKVLDAKSLDLLKSYGSKMSAQQRISFCRGHKKLDAEAEAVEKGYPATDVNWKDVRTRARKYIPDLEAIVRETKPRFFGATDEEKHTNQRGMNKVFNSNFEIYTPGYYGPRGSAILGEVVMMQLGSVLKELQKKNRVLASIGAAAYAQTVLVPELGLRLIMEDTKRPNKEAAEIMRDTVKMGELLNDEQEDFSDDEFEESGWIEV